MMTLHRYWFRFDPKTSGLPLGVRAGCGVTAYDRTDAWSLLSSRVFSGTLPDIVQVIEDVDVSTLDPAHVLPNMGSVFVRGVWFPKGY